MVEALCGGRVLVATFQQSRIERPVLTYFPFDIPLTTVITSTTVGFCPSGVTIGRAWNRLPTLGKGLNDCSQSDYWLIGRNTTQSLTSADPLDFCSAPDQLNSFGCTPSVVHKQNITLFTLSDARRCVRKEIKLCRGARCIL